ncbi:MAG: hypothetical protein O2840_00855 [bacterium]|nr:hypothetical protein [bacterium]
MPAAYLLEQLPISSGVPNRLRLLRQAQMLGLPVAPTLYISPGAIFASFLQQKNCAQLLEERRAFGDDPALVHLAEAKILQLFRATTLDTSLAKDIMQHYHQHLRGSFVRVFFTRGIATNTDNILGDSNLLESIILASHMLLELALAASRSAPTSVLEVAAGMCIQTQLQASGSGTTYSKHPLHPEKNVFAISARFGVTPPGKASEQLDWYEIHKSTGQETAVAIGTKTLTYKRTADSLEKKGVAAKQQLQRVLSKKQSELLAKLTASISQKEFLPLRVDWEMEGNSISITEITELDQPKTAQKSATVHTTQVVQPADSLWVRIDPSWKQRPDHLVTLIAELANTHQLEPKTNIIVPHVTSSHELAVMREHLLAATLAHQSRSYWPEITSVGMLHTLPESPALEFFAGIILDVPMLLRSLFVTPSWDEAELELLFSLIEEHVPTRLNRGIVLHAVTPTIISHLSGQVYKHVHTPTDLVQKVKAVLSDLEVERLNTLP